MSESVLEPDLYTTNSVPEKPEPNHNCTGTTPYSQDCKAQV